MKGEKNEEIRQNQPFCTFQTFAWPTNQPTNRQTCRLTWSLIEDALKNSCAIQWMTPGFLIHCSNVSDDCNSNKKKFRYFFGLSCFFWRSYYKSVFKLHDFKCRHSTDCRKSSETGYQLELNSREQNVTVLFENCLCIGGQWYDALANMIEIR